MEPDSMEKSFFFLFLYPFFSLLDAFSLFAEQEKEPQYKLLIHIQKGTNALLGLTGYRIGLGRFGFLGCFSFCF